VGKFDRKQLRKAIRKQGWGLNDTKDGFVAIAPNGDRVQWHNTPSDVRSDKNAMAEMRRRGFIWPWDPKRQKSIQRKKKGW
jgi:hypothetical protein